MSGHTPADNAAAREVILARIGEALKVPGRPPHLAAQAAPRPGHPGLPILAGEAGRPWLPDGGESPAESLAILADNLARLRATLVQVPDAAAGAAALAEQARQRGWRRIACHGDPLVAAALAGLDVPTVQVDHPGAAFDKNTVEACDAGVTACECLVAQTGSILVSSARGGRAVSILPHAHVVVATVDQVVPTLADAFDQMRSRHAGRLPSMLSFITGPSRTGDIERILVLGAHGPKELFVILVGEAPAR